MASYRFNRFCLLAGLAAGAAFAGSNSLGQQPARERAPQVRTKLDRSVRENATRTLAEGMQTFRYDTFGSEDFWGGRVQLHQAIQGEKAGGVGPGVSPKQALELGLKVDMDALNRCRAPKPPCTMRGTPPLHSGRPWQSSKNLRTSRTSLA